MPFTHENTKEHLAKSLTATELLRKNKSKIQKESEELVITGEEHEGTLRQDAKAEFLKIQRRVLKMLQAKTHVNKLERMEPKELADLLRVCRENIKAIRAAELLDQDAQDQRIEFVTVMPLDKGGVVKRKRGRPKGSKNKVIH